MLRAPRNFVSAFLPLIPLAFCHGCGGGGGAASTAQVSVNTPAAPAPAPAPAPVNGAPTITGTVNADALVGVSYDFQPTATDPEDDTLVFSATNLPPWASLDPSTGRISGTPGETDRGIYEAITITVADTANQTVSAAFSITVTGEVGSGVAALQWEVPASKVNGSPLDDLAGYRILYGRDSGDLDQSVLIADPATTSYEFSTLTSGIWYFAVVAVNAGGLEGPATTLATKSI